LVADGGAEVDQAVLVVEGMAPGELEQSRRAGANGGEGRGTGRPAVEYEPAVVGQVAPDGFEAAALVRRREQMHEGAIGHGDEVEAAPEIEIAHVGMDQLQLARDPADGPELSPANGEHGL